MDETEVNEAIQEALDKPKIPFNAQQLDAIEKAAQWFVDHKEGRPVNNVFFLAGYAGVGKEQPVSTNVQTPRGKLRFGDLTIGDEIFGCDGKPTKVIGIFPQGIKQVYKILFRDGSSTRCGIDHLWNVISKKTGEQITISLKEIIRKGVRFDSGPYRFKIPLCSPVEFYKQNSLPLDPYSLGVLIGEGYLRGTTPCVSISFNDMEILDRLKNRLPGYLKFNENRKQGCSQFSISDEQSLGNYGPNRLKVVLENLGLRVYSKERFIPEIYKTAEINDRIELLRGIMDADGCSVGNRISLSTKSERLANDVRELVQSLGGTAISQRYDREEKGIEYHVNVKVSFNPFNTPRKAKNWSYSEKNPPSRYIVDIYEDGFEEQMCIKVDAKDELYLTDELIVTHNTSVAAEIAERVKLYVESNPRKNGSKSSNVQFFAPTGKAAARLRQKGCHGAVTLHQIIYNVRGMDDEDKPIFAAKGALVEKPCLFIMDESSMIGEYDNDVLLRHGIPVLALGDTGQVEPVMARAVYKEGREDFILTEIMRQNTDSNIIRASMFVRQGKRLPPREYEDVRVRLGNPPITELMAHIDNDSQILCGYNATRKSINDKIRKQLGFSQSRLPLIGEKVICKFNQHKFGMMNGEQGIVLEYFTEEDWKRIGDDDDGNRIKLFSLTYNKETVVKFNSLSFSEDESERVAACRAVGGFDYGYAITVHSSQGSEWDNILFVEEVPKGNSYAKIVYTAITRAAKRLTLYRFE